MTDRDALREKIAALLRKQHCDRHAMDPDRYGFASLDADRQIAYRGDADAILALIEPLVGAVSNIRDCARGIMPLHTDMASLREQIIAFQDARWTRLYAIYAEADAALAQGRP